MQVSTEIVQQLMEAGYVACGRRLEALALRIFDGVEAVRPGSEAPAIGRGLAALSAGDPAAAVEWLQAAREAHPDSDAVKSFLGLALQFAGLSQQSEQVLREAATSGRDPHAAALAAAILHPSDE